MKLPSRKILRIRQTIYEDPGNPFADDIELARKEPKYSASDGKPLPAPPTVHRELSEQTTHDSDGTQLEAEASAGRPQVRRKPVAGPPAIQAAPSVNRRSKSVALPPSRSWDESEEEYVAPRTFWRKESAPTSDRDTKFYGFYDEIMSDYRGRESRKLE